MHKYLSLDMIGSLKLALLLELDSRKTVCLSEQIMFEVRYPCILSRQMEAVVYLEYRITSCCLQLRVTCHNYN